VHKFLLGEYVVKKLRKPHGCSFLLKSNCGSVKETSRDRDIVTLTESLGPQIMRQHNPPCKNSYYFSPKLTPLDTNLQNSSIFAAFYRLSLWNCRTSQDTSYHRYVYTRFKVKIIIVDAIVRAYLVARSEKNTELFLQVNSRPLLFTEFQINSFFLIIPPLDTIGQFIPAYILCIISNKAF